ncbi:unnamed protein product, partial [Discosporangium mesarthrocarpum]
MRELVRFLRQDKDVAEARLEISQQQVSRREAELDQARRMVREAREQAARDARELAGAVSEGEHRKLLAEVEQLSALRESNTMLRVAAKQAEADLVQAREKLSAVEAAAEPARRKMAGLEAEKASLSSQVESLKREVASWKNRVTSLTLSFNAVDPEEHKQVKAEKQSL